MLDHEFDRQYNAAVERGKTHRAKLLIERVNRLRFFVDAFQGRPNPVIETAAYLVLEAYQSRRRAVWRYFCHAVTGWFRGLRPEWEFKRRYWWYRLNGQPKRAAIENACDALEARFLSEGDEQ